MTDGWLLIDSAERAKAHPAHWVHPPDEELKKIRPGYYIKVGVHNPLTGSGERFWCRVFQIIPNGYKAIVTQDMLYTHRHGIKDRDELSLQPRHVFGIANVNQEFVWTTT